ncbi:hypothetical protein ANCDUO_01981 [Ancylostoma duodenale]|uniref:ATP-dependent DNA helicase n=1 Tax=Ancylostoma duodenale TaxID=51022 RepID=A0A0C2HDR7_9BILA|nr:hypothetical protein ANCDUO_01981 [Ancylostoma duodenale]
MPNELRALFGYMLAFCDISDPQQLFHRFKVCMAQDFIRSGLSSTEAEALAYYDLSDRLATLQYNLSDHVTPPALPRPELAPNQFGWEEHRRKGAEMYNCLNVNPRDAADSILASFDSGRQKMHFVDGPGGGGKTYLYNTIYHILKGQQKSVICVAWTGIAASLLPEERTASYTFKLNMSSSNRECLLKRQERDATPLKVADAIFWDEISMVPKFSLEAVDLLLQDLMCNTLPFGGKTVVIGGDFRQVLPIIGRGRERDMIDACVKNSRLWTESLTHHLFINVRAASSGVPWCSLLMAIGNGNVAQDNEGRIQLPSGTFSNGNLIDEVFGDQINDEDCLRDRAILAPRNIDVNQINEEALDRIPGLLREYKSIEMWQRMIQRT